MVGGRRPRNRRPGRRCSARLQGERGDVSPLVVLTPLTVLLVLFSVQMGLFFHARTVLNAAAQDATRALQLETATSADGRAAADAVLAGSEGFLTVTDLLVEDGPDVVAVEIRADVIAVVPFWSGSTSASASGPKERFRPEDER